MTGHRPVHVVDDAPESREEDRSTRQPLLEARGLVRTFPLRRTLSDRMRGAPRPEVRAVDGVDIQIRAGEAVGLAGESGSGKSVTADMLARLDTPTSGTITFRGIDITETFPKGLEEEFRRSVGMVFQDPYDSLNPRMKVGSILSEPLDIHKIGTEQDRRSRVEEMLGRVHLVPTSAYLEKYPHELSGGERQRVAIGRALMLDPVLLIADEPTTMLDVSVRSGLLNLIRREREENDLSILFISHDFSTLAYVCERLVIMYHGQVLESGPTAEVLSNQLHPYTQTLCAAIPVADPEHVRERVKAKAELGNVPDRGCPFEPRCHLREARCREQRPELVDLEPNHSVACHVVAAAKDKDEVSKREESNGSA